MRVALFKSLMIAFLLHQFGTFDDQWIGNFLSLLSLCQEKSLASTGLFTSTVYFIFGWLLLRFRNKSSG